MIVLTITIEEDKDGYVNVHMSTNAPKAKVSEIEIVQSIRFAMRNIMGQPKESKEFLKDVPRSGPQS